MWARMCLLALGSVALMWPVSPSPGTTSTISSIEQVSFVADAAVVRNRPTTWVAIPESVQAGDRLVLLLSANSSSRTVDPPSGVGAWTAEGEMSARSMTTWAWSRVATAADAGDTVTITMDARSKATLHLAAYRNVAAGALTVVPRAETVTSPLRRTPMAELSEPAWTVSYWATKSRSVTSWTAPDGPTTRRSVHNSGSGRIASLLADSGGPVSTGPYGDLEARTDSSSSAATTWTIVLGAAGAVEPPPDPTSVVQVTADAETEPVPESGDAADDPAVWVHPTEPAQSLVIGNDKRGALEVYGLEGTRLQRITTGTSFWGNVDVRQAVPIGGERRDVVVGYNGGLQMFEVDPATRRLTPVGDGSGAIRTGGGEGLCAYHSAQTDELSVFVITRQGRVRQFLIQDSDGDRLLEGTQVREFEVGSEAEGCFADDATGRLYVAEEERGLWRYGAEPGAGAARTLIDSIGGTGHLVFDVEGVTMAQTGATSGYLIVSAQNGDQPQQSYFTVYDRETNAYLWSFRIANGDAVDGCERTDGITAHAGDLGPTFPAGVFICQDNGNTSPAAGNQNFKLTRLDKILPGS